MLNLPNRSCFACMIVQARLKVPKDSARVKLPVEGVRNPVACIGAAVAGVSVLLRKDCTEGRLVAGNVHNSVKLRRELSRLQVTHRPPYSGCRARRPAAAGPHMCNAVAWNRESYPDSREAVH
eukprot:COSAG01_NODE_3501_length_6001_cov_5.894443_2_plen_123_part_00